MQGIIEKTINLAMQIQQIPAPTFDEARRAAFVKARFESEGLADISTDTLGNVYARLPGANPGLAPLVISAHTDTVFPAQTRLDISWTEEKIAAPGIGDNSLGVAGLFALAWNARLEAPYPGDIWLVANVCEEGLGDLRGMRAVVDRFGSRPRGYIILEGMALGHIYHRGLGVRRYRITARTAGGHSWANFGAPSAIHHLARLINQITSITLPETPRCSYNVGTISGGTSVNTIAQFATFDLDLRSESPLMLDDLVEKVEKMVDEANQEGVAILAEVIGNRPAGEISRQHPLVAMAVRALEAQKLTPVIGVGSTDANVPISLGLPAVCIGLTQGGGAHTTEEYILTRPLKKGLDQLYMLARGAFELE